MKIVIATLTVIFFLYSCSQQKEEAKTEAPVVVVDTTLLFFGDTITMDNAIKADQLINKLASKDSVNVKISGIIEEVCQKKGCWMNMNIGNGQSMKIMFRDYAFFVPKDAAGKAVYVEGFAFHDTISIADLKHYAEDAGVKKEEIAKITKPEINISFEANGVIIKK